MAPARVSGTCTVSEDLGSANHPIPFPLVSLSLIFGCCHSCGQTVSLQLFTIVYSRRWLMEEGGQNVWHSPLAVPRERPRLAKRYTLQPEYARPLYVVCSERGLRNGWVGKMSRHYASDDQSVISIIRLVSRTLTTPSEKLTKDQQCLSLRA
jgi:hypothetical protein